MTAQKLLLLTSLVFTQSAFAIVTTCTLTDGSVYTIQPSAGKTPSDLKNYEITGPGISTTTVESVLISPLHLYKSNDNSIKIQFTSSYNFGLGIVKLPGKPVLAAECEQAKDAKAVSYPVFPIEKEEAAFAASQKQRGICFRNCN